MMELTLPQLQAMELPTSGPPRIVNPQTNQTFVLLKVEDYERLIDDDYDGSDWTREEMQALAWHRLERAGTLDEWSEYDDPENA